MIEWSFEALEENAVGFRRVEGFLERAFDVLGDSDVADAVRPSAFDAAMDDDLGVSQALAVVHDTVREGNAALAAGDVVSARAHRDSVVAMLDVLGVNPYSDVWASGSGDDDRLRAAVDHLVSGLLEARASAREAKDWATADAIRDQLKGAGIVVDDTNGGSRWSLDPGKDL
jgi:cysteinyl-tRNA synthetase